MDRGSTWLPGSKYLTEANKSWNKTQQAKNKQDGEPWKQTHSKNTQQTLKTNKKHLARSGSKWLPGSKYLTESNKNSKNTELTKNKTKDGKPWTQQSMDNKQADPQIQSLEHLWNVTPTCLAPNRSQKQTHIGQNKLINKDETWYGNPWNKTNTEKLQQQ